MKGMARHHNLPLQNGTFSSSEGLDLSRFSDVSFSISIDETCDEGISSISLWRVSLLSTIGLP